MTNRFIKLFAVVIALLIGSTAISQTTWNIVPGWNLLGNSSIGPLEVTYQGLGNPDQTNSIWTWNATTSKWSFYAPSLSDTDLSAYAKSKSYDVLSSIAAQQGFWVNAATAFTVTSGWNNSYAALAESNFKIGWNLVGGAGNTTPLQLNKLLQASLNVAGQDITSVWTWDSTSSTWRFFAPSLEAQGSSVLSDYISTHGYIPFTTGISNSDGVWINIVKFDPLASSPTPFFTEVIGAFADPNTVLAISDGVMPTFITAVPADLNNDGKSELVLLLHNWNTGAVLLPCPNRLAIFSLGENNKFTETTSQYIDGPTNINACGEHFEVIDINLDGKADIIFATDQTDGRGYTPEDMLRVPGNLIGFVSQPNGKYTLQSFGPPEPYYSLALGTNADGSTFITSGPQGYTPRNNQYIYQGGSFVEMASTLPNISPSAAQFLNSQQKGKSDILIQASQHSGALDAYLLDANGNWNNTDTQVSPYPIIGQETAITTRGSNLIDIFNINGQPSSVLGFDGSCKIRLSPSSRSIAVIRLLGGIIDNYIPGQILHGDGEIVGTNAVRLFGADVVNGKVKIIGLNISGEDLKVNYNHIMCKDINGDGYDDIVLYNLSSGNAGAIPIVYLNNQNGGFTRINPDIFPIFRSASMIGQVSSIMADFTGDGIVDMVNFPLNLWGVTNLAGSLRLFKGIMPLAIK